MINIDLTPCIFKTQIFKSRRKHRTCKI